MSMLNTLENITSPNKEKAITKAIVESVATEQVQKSSDSQYIAFLEALIESELGHDSEVLRESSIDYHAALLEDSEQPTVTTDTVEDTENQEEVKTIKENEVDILARFI